MSILPWYWTLIGTVCHIVAAVGTLLLALSCAPNPRSLSDSGRSPQTFRIPLWLAYVAITVRTLGVGPGP